MNESYINMIDKNDAYNNVSSPDDNIEKHLVFTEDLINKYDWELSDLLDFESRLFHIKRKQQDKNLNLSVVGEFGTGKSTLINALLRSDEFLVSSSLQGTTVAATIVEDSSECGILLEYMNEQQEYRHFDNIEALKEGLVSCTTNPDIAKKLYNVRIRMPNEHLKSGFRIIDTPGLNATEAWHEKVTLRTIDEMSDMSVLIIDANKPLTTSFCEFVKQNFGGALHQCVFLVTRIDMIRKRERQGVLDYLKMKVMKEFSLEDAVVLPYSSISVLDELAGQPSELSALSHETETALLVHMEKQKALAQSQKLEALIDDMYACMSEKMKLLSQGYKGELDLLLKSKQIDLVPFVEEQKKQRLNSFTEKSANKRSDIIDYLDVLSQDIHSKILANIDTMSTLDNLKCFVNVSLETLCARAASDIVNHGIIESNALQDLFADEMLGFHRAFEKEFKDYQLLNLDISNDIFENLVFPSLQTSELFSASTTIANQLANKKSTIGGTAAGAAIGSMIMPGVGTLVGGFIGFLTKSTSTNIVKARQETKEKLSAPLKGYLGSVINNFARALNPYIEDLKHSIGTELNKYLDTYQSAVNSRIEAEEKKIALIENKIRNIQIDMEQVVERKQMLTPVSRKDV